MSAETVRQLKVCVDMRDELLAERAVIDIKINAMNEAIKALGGKPRAIKVPTDD